MPIPCYLAMTGAEFLHTDRFPDKLAWMACHYSCYGTGLSNLPDRLPEGSLIILNDRTPPYEHDTTLITQQLQQLHEELHPFGFLLDFQRADLPENKEVAEAVSAALPCPVAVSELYAEDLSVPVFLPPPPLDMPLSKYIAPWHNRRIWLEIGLEATVFTITEEGCTVLPGSLDPLPNPHFDAPDFYCRYHWELRGNKAIFTLQRTLDEVSALVETAQGIDLAIGFYQQLGAEF